MPRYTTAGLPRIALAILLLGPTFSTIAQTTTAPATQATSAPPLMPNRSMQTPAPIDVAERSPLESIELPQFDFPATALFGAVVVLVLFLTSRPVTTGRSLDACVLALGCLLLSLRGGAPALFGPSTAWVTYTLLTLIGAYWLARGLVFMRASSVSRTTVGVGESAQGILAVAALLFGMHAIANNPLTKASQDGLIGGVHLLHTGHMPYGETISYDGQSPLVYALHAGIARLMPPEFAVGSELVPLTWDRRDLWSGVNWAETEGVAAARMVNAILFLLCLVGLMLLGRWLHSVSMGLALAAAFGVMPGVHECLSRPDIMLPVALLVWTLFFATLPGLGALLAGALMVLAGLAWPWLWLALPALLMWFASRGWVGTAGAIGMVGGVAGVVFVTVGLTIPSPPRPTGAIAAAGITPTHIARLDGSRIVIAAHPGVASASIGLRAKLWQMLLDRESGATAIRDPNVNFEGAPGDLSFREVAVAPEARDTLTPLYRTAVSANGYLPRLRTLLEAVWLPAVPSEPTARGAWHVWGSDSPERDEQMVTVRRAMKVAAGILAMLLAVMVIVNRLNQPYQLVGVMTAISAAALIASESGAVANLALLLTPALLLFAVDGTATRVATDEAKRIDDAPSPPTGRGSSPRITVE